MHPKGAAEDHTRGDRQQDVHHKRPGCHARYGLTPKIPQKVYIKRAGKEAVRGWQHRFGRRVSRLEEDEFTIVDEDGAFLIHDVRPAANIGPAGERIVVLYTGSHKKIVVYGTIAKDGRQFFRTHERFDTPTLVGYLKEMQRHFGKVAVVMNRASPHRAGLVRRLLWENKNTKIIYLPKGSPYLNVVEECWRQGKQILPSHNTIERLPTCVMPSYVLPNREIQAGHTQICPQKGSATLHEFLIGAIGMDFQTIALFHA